jgi:GntR family transcriptional regulator/MocR family aminotransferase
MKKANAPLFQELFLEKGVIKDQVYSALRKAIVEGRLALGAKIPSTRALAEMMAISRNSVIAGYDRLYDEGYIVTLKGAGTFVAQNIPDRSISNPNALQPQSDDISLDGALNIDITRVRNQWSEQLTADERNPLFRIGVGCIDLFPHGLWGRLLGQVWKASRYELGLHTSPNGFQPLRKAISHYIQSTRGVNCHEDNIIIVNGIQQAMSITARALLSKGDEVWLDDPGYKGARGVFMSAGALVRPVQVDDEGMDVSDGIRRFPGAKLAYVVPSDQYPLGGTLSLSRRRELLAWAESNRAWIFEDDYNSEFRYVDRAVQALQGLDTQQRVIYAGTFSKMMYPEFRIGFLVVPPGLKEQFVVTKYLADLSTGYLEQAVLARFIEDGHYARHVRRVRKTCYERKTALVKAIQHYLDGKMTVQPSDSGVHIVCWLHDGLTGRDVEEKARQLGMGIQALDHYYHGGRSREGILIGFANHSPQSMIEGIRRLAEVI